MVKTNCIFLLVYFFIHTANASWRRLPDGTWVNDAVEARAFRGSGIFSPMIVPPFPAMPAPVPAMPAPVPAMPAPVPAMPAPVPAMPAPVPTMPAPVPAMPANNYYRPHFDPTDDYHLKPLNKSQQKELYWQTIVDIGNRKRLFTADSVNEGGGPPPPEIIEQKPADFNENKFEIYDELMLIANDSTNSRISELITPFHTTSSYTVISAGDNSIKTKQKSAWVRGLYGFINQGQELEQMGFKGNNYGGTVGIDTNITDDTLIGISYTKMFANFKYKIGPGNRANATSDVFSLYGVSELINDFILQGLASIGRIQVKQQTQRKIDINKFKTVYSSFDVDSYSAEAVLNYQVSNLQRYYIMPNIGMRFSKSYDEGYEETNAGVFNMKTSPRSYNRWLLLVGTKAGINYNLSENLSLIPGVHIQVGKYIGNKANDYQVATVVTSVTANVPVKSRGTAYNIGSTLRIGYKNKADILFSYNAHLIGKYRSHQGSLSFKYFF